MSVVEIVDEFCEKTGRPLPSGRRPASEYALKRYMARMRAKAEDKKRWSRILEKVRPVCRLRLPLLLRRLTGSLGAGRTAT